MTLVSLAILYLVNFVIQVALLVHIPRYRKPTAALAWLLFIYMIPIIGLVTFLLIGSTKPSRKRRDEQKKINNLLKDYTEKLRKENLIYDEDGPYSSVYKLGESLSSLAPTKGNSVEVLHGYSEIFDDIINKINVAKVNVFVEFYIMALDSETERFFEALKNAAERGVEVKVLFDTWGSQKFPRYKEMMQFMTENGISWRKMLPLNINPFGERGYNRFDLRNHRKIVVVDNRYAFIGSLNAIERRYHRKDDIYYTELMVRLEGPSVNEAAAVFASDWRLETDENLKPDIMKPMKSPRGNITAQVLPSGPNFPYRNNLLVFNALFQSAKNSIIINNPYLVPDESLLASLISATKRGVRVSILNSEAVDQRVVAHAQRSYYSELLKAGVEIYLFNKPQLVHDKYITIDGKVSVVGSSNLDIRSFELNQECVVIIEDDVTAKKLEDRQLNLLKTSKRLTLKEWEKRSFLNSLLDSVARLTSALQ